MIEQLKKHELVHNGDKIVITHGDGKFFKQGTSNSIRVEIIKDVPKEGTIKKDEDITLEASIPNGRIILDTAICASCQTCIDICPHDIWTINSKKDTVINVNNAKNCTKDFECVNQCPTGAIEIISTDI